MSVKVPPNMRHHIGRAPWNHSQAPRKPVIYLCENCLAPVVQVGAHPLAWQHGIADWAACGQVSHSPLPTLNASKEAVETQYDAEAAEWSFERDRLLDEIEAEHKRGDFYMHWLDLINAGQALTAEEWDAIDNAILAEKNSESDRIWGAF